MSKPIIVVDNISKRYRIGKKERAHTTFREAIVDAFAAPIRNFRQLRKLTKYNNGVREKQEDDVIWALRDVSFEVRPGEVLGIIGRNGAGKSTLLKVLSRIIEPTTGEAKIYGRVSSLLEVGTGFHTELTGRENIYLNGTILGMRKVEIDRKFDAIVDFAEIEKFIDTPVKRYSSGMYVRLAFGVAAYLEPEILLVDEVLAVGDLAFQKKCLGKMGEVAKGGRTVLFVSHNMDAVRKLCDRGILLDLGRVQVVGETDTVMAQYVSAGMERSGGTIMLPAGPPAIPIVGKFLYFLDASGTPRDKFYLKETWRIVLKFELFKPLQHVIAGVGVKTTTGIPILTYWSKPKDLTPGRYLVEFPMDVPLRQCDLEFVVGLSSYERSAYHVGGVGQVSILDVAKDGQPFRVSGRAGILLTEPESEIVPLLDDNLPKGNAKENNTLQ